MKFPFLGANLVSGLGNLKEEPSPKDVQVFKPATRWSR